MDGGAFEIFEDLTDHYLYRNKYWYVGTCQCRRLGCGYTWLRWADGRIQRKGWQCFGWKLEPQDDGVVDAWRERNAMLPARVLWTTSSERTVENDAVAERGHARSALLVLSFESSDLRAMLLQKGCFCLRMFRRANNINIYNQLEIGDICRACVEELDMKI